MTSTGFAPNHDQIPADESGAESQVTSIEQLSDESLQSVLDTLRSGNPRISSDTGTLEAGGILNGGGSKNIYDAVLDGQPVVLGLPNEIDVGAKVREKWAVVEREPENTSQLRAMGLLVNPRCELETVTIDSIPFPAIVMMRYQDLPFGVLDGKNRTSSTEIAPLDLGNDQDRLTQIALPALGDIATIIRSGVNLRKDSFNIAATEDGLRLYLNDLGNAGFNVVKSEEWEMYIKGYTRFFVEKLLNGLSERDYQSNKPLIEALVNDMFDDSGAFLKLTDAVRQQLLT